MLTASRVLMTTNGLIGPLLPAVQRSLLPVRGFQIATQVLSREIQDRFLPGRSPVADTRRHTFAVRWSPDGRLMTGGAVLPGPDSLGRAARRFARRLETFMPEVGPIQTEYVWSGLIAVTGDWLPRYMAVATGLDALIGCNGRGVALTTALGRETAALLAGPRRIDEFPVPHRPPRRIPFQPIAQQGPALWLPWSEFRDWQETRPR